MKFRVERDVLMDAVSRVARTVPNRPQVPVLSGVLVQAANGTVCLSAFDFTQSARQSVPADVMVDGQALVSGRLLADIVKALPGKPVNVELVDSKVSIRCGSSRFTLLTMPVDEYPGLPRIPKSAGVLDGIVFGDMVERVAVAAGRDESLPVLTGVLVESTDNEITMMATDRYRLTLCTVPWCGKPGRALVPARILSDVAKSTGAGDVTIGLSDGGSNGLVGFSQGMGQSTSLLMDGEYPKVMSLFPDAFAAHAVVDRATLADAAKRVSLVAERNTPVFLAFDGATVTITAGQGEDAQASEALDCDGGDIGEFSVAFNPRFLLDGIGALSHPFARLSFTQPTKPAVITGQAAVDGDDDTSYRYLLMPVRLAG